MPDRTTQNNNMTANVASLAFMGLFRMHGVPGAFWARANKKVKRQSNYQNATGFSMNYVVWSR